MASGTIILSSTRNVLEGRINWSSSSNGSNANTSNVWAELQVRRNDGYTTTGTWTGAMNIGGQEQSFSVHTSVGSSWVTMLSFTKNNVAHNDNGTGTCWISGYCNGPNGTSMAGESVSGSQTVTLDTIARKLSITQFSIQTRQINKVVVKWAVSNPRNLTEYSLNNGTWTGSGTNGESVASDQKSGTFNIPNLSPNTTYSLKIRCRRSDSGLYTESNTISFTTYDYAKLSSVPNVSIGASQKITWTNPNSASISLKLCKTDNSQIINYGTVTGTSKTVTPTASTIYALTPNSNTYKARYILTTTQNSKTYTSTKDFTFTVTNSNPTFSNFTYIDSNSTTVALTGNNQHLINKHSSVRATISTANKAVAKNSATMKTYRLTVGNKTKDTNYSSSAAVNIEVTNITSSTITVYAIDSRNNSTSKNISATKFINYDDINVKNITLTRSDGGVGQKVTLTYNGYIWNSNFGTKKNSIKSIKYQYKKSNSSTWITGKTTLNPTLSGNNYSQTIEIQGDLAGEGFSRESAFDFRITVSDELSTATKTVVMTSGIPLLAYARNGIAVLMPYDDSIDAALQVNGKINIPHGGPGTAGLMFNNKEVVRTSDSGELILSTEAGGIIYLRPNGSSSQDGEVTIDENGNLKAPSIQSKGTLQSTGNIKTNGTVQARGSEPVYSAKLLFSNSSGVTGTINLSESASNFTNIEIFYGKNYSFSNSIKVRTSNAGSVGLMYGYCDGTIVQIGCRVVAVSGTSITNSSYYGGTNIYTTGNVEVFKTNEIKIFAVLGYR